MKHWKYDEIDDPALRLKLFGGPQGGKAQKAGKPIGDGGDKYPGTEKQFQAEAEAWLIGRGYARRTLKNIANPDCNVWFLHFPNEHAKSNPLILDFILLRAGHFKSIELKVEGGTIKPHQAQLIAQDDGAVAWNMVDFAYEVIKWEQKLRFEQQLIEEASDE